MEVSSKVTNILSALKELYPDALCALHFGKDYELMIAVRLSAQCTDARVNLVTPALFAKYPTLEAFAAADVGDVEEMARSCGFYKHKARDIVLACQMLLSDYHGRVPDNMEDLLKLPRGWPEDGESAAGGHLPQGGLRLRYPLHPHLRQAGAQPRARIPRRWK